MPARLVLSGGFTVTDSQQRHLQQQARHLGFDDLRACLQALLDDGRSVPQPSRRQRLARQRQRVAEQRAFDRVAKLGFPSVRTYLVDRLAIKAWTLRQIEDELSVAPATLRRLLDQHHVQRVGPTRRQRAAAAAAAGPAKQARAVQQRRQTGCLRRQG